MINIKNKKAFTLIELLVVITIIGILATAGIGIFTTQLQKSRDSSRQTDLKMYQTAVTQFFSDKSAYPGYSGSTIAFTGGVMPYVSNLKEDPKAGVDNCRTAGNAAMKCNYTYTVGNDQSGIPDQSFKLSTTLENFDNVKNLSLNTKDGSTWAPTGTDNVSGASWFEVFGGNQGAALFATGSTVGTNSDGTTVVTTGGGQGFVAIRK
ncbi:MAG: type II secretion system protein [Candidatus Gracilibacteria bacterium]|nr:type II secretion system protein [Candidatus Gracilibacteria bacterium]